MLIFNHCNISVRGIIFTLLPGQPSTKGANLSSSSEKFVHHTRQPFVAQKYDTVLLELFAFTGMSLYMYVACWVSMCKCIFRFV